MPRRYTVKGILPTASLVVVWGPPKCGKSFFIFDMVAHIAAGWLYRDLRVKQCAVIYFALEGQLGFEARIEAFRKAYSIVTTWWPPRLSILSRGRGNCRLFLSHFVAIFLHATLHPPQRRWRALGRVTGKKVFVRPVPVLLGQLP